MMRYGSETVSFLNPLLSMFSILLLPAALLLTAGILLEYSIVELSKAQLAVLRYLPVLLLGGGLFVAFRFNRLRMFATAGNLLCAYMALSFLPASLTEADQATLLALLLLLAPINHLATHVLPDRGVHPGAHAAMLGTVAFEAFIIWIVLWLPMEGIARLLQLEFITFVETGSNSLPDTGVVALGLLLLLSFARLYSLANTQRAALFASSFCLALVFAVHAEAVPLVTYASVAALLLLVAILQESWNIAYLDQLTELPGRRALDEALGKLEGTYSVAMVDVDHFKKFNDTYGHDIGDQVLRMVASRLRDVRGGGKAYRYGGEEFTLLFPNRGASESLAHVEEVRELIEGDSFELRQRDRRDDKGKKRKKAPVISITVSAGLAERKGKAVPEDVIKSADKALYKAKRAGRNRVKKA